MLPRRNIISYSGRTRKGDVFTVSAFGENLRRAREAKGLTQQELAEHLGLVRGTIIRWEAGGEVEAGPAVLVKMAQKVGTTLEGLTGDAPLFPESDERYAAGVRATVREVMTFAESLTKDRASLFKGDAPLSAYEPSDAADATVGRGSQRPGRGKGGRASTKKRA